MISPSIRRRARRGFSILELLLVLVILAILAGIVAVKFGGQSEKARVTATKTQLGNFNMALNRFELDLGRYPTTSEGLRALIEKPGDDTAGKWQRYLDSNDIPKDPWNHDWNYRQPGQRNPDGYDLSSNGPDGREGGDDDICNWSNSATAVTR